MLLYDLHILDILTGPKVACNKLDANARAYVHGQRKLLDTFLVGKKESGELKYCMMMLGVLSNERIWPIHIQHIKYFMKVRSL